MIDLSYDLDNVYEGPSTGSLRFHTRTNGVKAFGHYNKDTNEFTVLAESEIDLSFKATKSKTVAELRSEFFGSSTKRERLPCDVKLSSPTAAAEFVLGSSRNGWMHWFNDRGQTLDSVYRGKKG